MKRIQLIDITVEELSDFFEKQLDEKLKIITKNFQPKEPTEFLSRKQTAEILDINLSTLWNWTNKGLIQAYGAGNRVYFKRKDIEAMLKPINEVKP